MDERRKSPRIRCRLSCELESQRASGPGTAVDLSEGGLCIHTALAVEQGESLRIALAAPGAGTLELEALAWHVRRVRDRSGQTFQVVGAMISRAPEAYARLVPSSSPRPAARRACDAPSAPEPGARDHHSCAAAGRADPAEGAELRTFRIRVKAVVGPRTRTLSLSATSEDEARALAVEDLQGQWEVLEVVAA
jgi:hypothetical protein